jgi:hypothetical protein
MSCTICGRATGPGALLCKPCKAALKRARQFSVLEIPGVSASVIEMGVPASPPQRARRAVARARRPTGWTFALACALLAFAAFLFAAQFKTRIDAPVPSSPAPRVEAPPTEIAAAHDVADPLPLTRTISAPARARAKIAAPPAPVAVDVVQAPEPQAPAAATAPVVVVAAPVAPPPDRWQLMAEARARCASEGGLSGFICDQRVRLDSCDGYWGRVPQCPRAPEYSR